MNATAAAPLRFQHRHILGIEGMSADEIVFLLDLSDSYVARGDAAERKSLLRGRTLINLFFESST
ncbi:MAG TPA: aspartate carbamoyltransferase catalytic subunit, partial [Propylenella sp.]